ncbi:MAG TPA: hypothetical protein VF461_18995 [Gemmatimonadaceae bacterium]
MRSWHAVAALVFCASVFAACKSMDEIATPARDARAQHVLRSLANGERDALLATKRVGDDSAAAAKGLAQIDSIFRGQRLDSIQVIGANEFSSPSEDRLTLTYEMHTSRGWLLASVTTLDSAGTAVLTGLHAEPLPGELRKLNEFTLAGKGASQYLTLIVTIALTVFSFGVAVFLATRREFPKRWRWVAASLVGAGAVYVNWTTGEVGSRLVTVQLLSGAAVQASAYAPWVISFSFPIGAIVALDRFRRWNAGRTVAVPAAVVADASPPSEATS